jgi:hypothetical protein
MKAFLDEYNYNPTQDPKDVAEDLYDEVGAIAMALIEAKIKQARRKI